MGKIGYLLGAGASTHAGYPVAAGFPRALADFIATLPTDGSAADLRQWSLEVAAGLERYECETLDQLAYRTRRDNGGELILKGKAVLSALFFSLEATANLSRYQRLAETVFTGADIFPDTDVFILTYNYDRCLQRAVYNVMSGLRGHDAPQEKVWDALNCGFNLTYERFTRIDEARFSALPMHGLIGNLWQSGASTDDDCRGIQLNDFGKVAINDSLLVPFRHPDYRYSRSLIIFPFEAGDRHEKLNEIQAEVDRAAGDLVEQADQLKIIGYSYDDVNRRRLDDLLKRATTCTSVMSFDPSDVAQKRLRATMKRLRLNVDIEPFDTW